MPPSSARRGSSAGGAQWRGLAGLLRGLRRSLAGFVVVAMGRRGATGGGLSGEIFRAGEERIDGLVGW